MKKQFPKKIKINIENEQFLQQKQRNILVRIESEDGEYSSNQYKKLRIIRHKKIGWFEMGFDASKKINQKTFPLQTYSVDLTEDGVFFILTCSENSGIKMCIENIDDQETKLDYNSFGDYVQFEPFQEDQLMLNKPFKAYISIRKKKIDDDRVYWFVRKNKKIFINTNEKLKHLFNILLFLESQIVINFSYIRFLQMTNCNKWLIQNAEYICPYVQQNCNFQKRFNFVEYYNCNDIEFEYMCFYTILLVLFLYSVIIFISNNYFSQIIQKIKIYINTSQMVASSTILAISNTFPDLCASLASNKNIEGNNFVMTTLIGDLMFNTSMTSAFVIFMSNCELKINGVNTIKEIIAYLISLGILLFTSYYYKKIYFWNILIFIALYLFYIYITKKISDQNKKSFSFTFQQTQEFYCQDAIIVNKQDIDQCKEHKQQLKIKILNKDIDINKILKHIKLTIKFPYLILAQLTIPVQSNILFQNLYFRYSVLFFTSYFLLATILNTLQVRFGLLLFLTLFLIFMDIILNFTIQLHQIFFDFIGLLSCLCWLLNCIFLLLDIFLFFSVYISVNPAVISVVLISIGNQMIDFFNNGAIAKQGLSKMAFYGCFSTSFVNFIITIALNTTQEMIEEGKLSVKFEIFRYTRKSEYLLIFQIYFAIFYLILLSIVLCIARFNLGKYFALFLVTCYLIFLSSLFYYHDQIYNRFLLNQFVIIQLL